ncbi:hypothetical protein OsI_27641 [Oryza sativa Indica Group]|uniref:Uncharacterized protein n=1 Tax=Oryza sativa subsp. indica TaxID=39946 RepID=B8BAD9_ORYSI|nr:hypothetical protein OsI_27641 [Oryza sativa Indica Group]
MARTPSRLKGGAKMKETGKSKMWRASSSFSSNPSPSSSSSTTAPLRAASFACHRLAGLPAPPTTASLHVVGFERCRSAHRRNCKKKTTGSKYSLRLIL